MFLLLLLIKITPLYFDLSFLSALQMFVGWFYSAIIGKKLNLEDTCVCGTSLFLFLIVLWSDAKCMIDMIDSTN